MAGWHHRLNEHESERLFGFTRFLNTLPRPSLPLGRRGHRCSRSLAAFLGLGARKSGSLGQVSSSGLPLEGPGQPRNSPSRSYACSVCQHTPVFLPGESQGRGSLVGCHLWGRTESDVTEAT